MLTTADTESRERPMAPTPDYLRAEIARRMINRYMLAAAVGVHPGRLGQMLNGRVPMPDEVAQRIGEVLAGADATAKDA
jgi:hypothetical protein